MDEKVDRQRQKLTLTIASSGTPESIQLILALVWSTLVEKTDRYGTGGTV